MKYPVSFSSLCRQTLVAAAIGAAYASASAALPQFTISPGGSNPALAGSNVTGDTMLLSDFSAVTFTGAAFNESGFLSVTGFQDGGTNLTPVGLNSTYSLYYQFDATGHLTSPNIDPSAGSTFGVFDTLDFSLIGADNNSTFGFSGNTPTVNSTNTRVLATGSLMNGNNSTTPPLGGQPFSPSANLMTTFDVAAGQEGFFVSPSPFYNVSFSAFTNPSTTVETYQNGFRINNGGGSLNFAAPVPEPETYALMLAGLGVVGWVARRRKKA